MDWKVILTALGVCVLFSGTIFSIWYIVPMLVEKIKAQKKAKKTLDGNKFKNNKVHDIDGALDVRKTSKGIEGTIKAVLRPKEVKKLEESFKNLGVSVEEANAALNVLSPAVPEREVEESAETEVEDITNFMSVSNVIASVPPAPVDGSVRWNENTGQMEIYSTQEGRFIPMVERVFGSGSDSEVGGGDGGGGEGVVRVEGELRMGAINARANIIGEIRESIRNETDEPTSEEQGEFAENTLKKVLEQRKQKRKRR